MEEENNKKNDKRTIIVLISIIVLIVLFVLVGAIFKSESLYRILDVEREETTKKEEPPKEIEQPVQPVEEPDIEEDPFPEAKLNIEEVIQEYHLEDIKDIIEEDKDLFQLYAYYVINNNNIKYKEIMLRSYIPVYYNKDILNKKEFIKSLQDLIIVEVSQLEQDSAIGIYDDSLTYIKILEGTKEYVIYHELMHFIEHRLPGTHTEINNICYDNSKYTSTKNKECKKKISLPNSAFITEAGTETSLARYLNIAPDSYNQITNSYNLLAYIVGDKELNDIYFSNDSLTELFLLLHKYGITYEEYIEFIELTNKLTDEQAIIKHEVTELESHAKVLNIINKIYHKKFGHGWEDDETFSFLMRLTYNRTGFSFTIGTDDYKYIDLIGLTESEKQIIKQDVNLKELVNDIEEYKDYYVVDTYSIVIKDNKVYIGVDINKDVTFKSLLIEYDIHNNKIINYIES